MYKQLKKSPIEEAIIEIHFRPYVELKRGDIRLFSRSFDQSFKIEEVTEHEREFKDEEKDFLDSIVLSNKEKGFTIQISQSKLVVVKSKPYINFDELYSVFIEIWKHVFVTFKPQNVTQTVLQYINKINLTQNVDFYVRNAGMFRINDDMEQKSSYHRFDFEKGKSKGMVQFFLSGESQRSLIIDISVHSDYGYTPKQHDITERLLNSFRKVKNDLFFNIVTENYKNTLE